MKYFIILFCLIPSLVISQDFSNSWEDLFSYNQIKDVSYGNGKVYAAAENAVFTYQRNTGEIEKISSVNGLSGESISTIHYSGGYNLLIIGYENGLIDVYNTNEEKVTSFIDIVEKQTIPPPERKINHFFEFNDRLFIATEYGISEFNLANLEFGDTYFIGDGGSRLAVTQTTVYQNRIYAATKENGVRYAGVTNPNLIDFSVWQTISSGTFLGVVSLSNSLYVIDESNSLLRLQQNDFVQELQFNSTISDLRVNNDQLVVTLINGVKIYDQVLNPVANIGSPSGMSTNYSAALIYLGEIFIGDNTQGLLQTRTTNPFQFNFLSPSGPIQNDVFDLETIPNEVWVTYGEYDGFLNAFPINSRGISHLINDEWFNTPYFMLNARNIVKATINPAQTGQVILSSYFDGIVDIQNEEIANRYDASNSSLESVVGTALTTDVWVNGAAFDREGNLWGNASKVEKGLFKLDIENNQIETFDITEIVPDATGDNLGLTELVIDNIGNIYFGSYSNGIIGYNPATNSFAKVEGGEGAGNLPENYVNSLALDNNNQLWVGTSRGLRVLFNPAGMFENSNVSTNQIIIEDEDGVAQELLAGLNIIGITVDGNNNKWIATGAGAFYLSSNGQETIYQFTKDNSPLPSNTISDIAIDDASGKVYIGTDKGLLAFRGTATATADNLENVRAYPNPVRPQYNGLVTIDGLMENANVKITDIEGNLVYEEFSEGGSVQWDTKAFGKHKVASGVYMVLITSEDQLETKVAKIMIIR
ncbi:type IX secretion system anionic LPS delivery protein PorZ [Mesonia aquimarina]|uniref:type IX secretion system anionic LPS delivery protein PorZ n=1 Tax=Mesonia aquimarina TaxID=1504967 RepID=UPI000EF605F3|nr:two-component regulator propeller domain-containing protein [Mesonia aquimarina]